MLDLLLQNGLICDGTGTSPFVGDVSIRDGKIVEIAPHITEEARETVDVSGLVIAPAFIDMHSHSDAWFMKDDRCQAKRYQGVATEVVGQCGSSQFPRSVSQVSRIRRETEAGKLSEMGAYQAGTFEKLRRLRADRKMSTNLVQMIGHNAIRNGVVGPMARPAWEDEIKISQFLLTQAIEQGVWGMSLGLGYVPGLFADKAELASLMEICYIDDIMVSVHMRNECERVFESLEEMIDLAKMTKVRLHISHLKLGAKEVWGKAEELYNRIQQANAEGARITADLYPYNACSTGLSSRLPDWALDGGSTRCAKRLEKEPDFRAQVLEYLRPRYPQREDGDRLYIVGTGGRCPDIDGKTVGQLSEEWGMPVPEAIIETLIRTQGQDDSIITNMDEKDVLWLLGRNDLTIGSDASCRPFDPAASDGKPHPRTYGTFPRFLRLCREHDLCPVETAVHRITQLPASIVGLTDRGVLKAGMVADVTVFNKDTITDTATYDEPFQKPVGVEHVIMNGKFALKNGEQTEERLGDYLLKPYI